MQRQSHLQYNAVWRALFGKDILDEAMINRSTFDLHLSDKYAILERLQEKYIAGMTDPCLFQTRHKTEAGRRRARLCVLSFCRMSFRMENTQFRTQGRP